MTPSRSAFTDRVLELYRDQGHLAYEGEGVSQLEHAAQCGALACEAGASVVLQVAAWLHDIGHLLAGLPGTPTLNGVDDGHEVCGAAFLAEACGAAIAQPVALHVAAKRYLVATRHDYHDRLSPDSRRSLALQGGPMSRVDQRAFIEQPFARDALRVRAWDDAGKRARAGAGDIDRLARLLREAWPA